MPVFPLNSASVWHSEGRVFHANPIIGYADDNSFAVFLFYPYGKMPGYFLTFLQPMGNCIFYQGLKGSFRYQVFHQVIVEFLFINKCVGKAQLLKTDIGTYVFRFLSQRDKFFSVAQAEPVKGGQRGYGVFNLGKHPFFGKPLNHIQCVVKEMGIDLCLQDFKLRCFCFLAEKIFLFNQLLHGVYHVIIGACQFSDFVLSLNERSGQRNQFAFFYMPHPGGKAYDPSGHGFR